MNRRTSTYQIEIPGDEGVLQCMIERCPVDHEATVVRQGECLLRFRTHDDKQALSIASRIAGGSHYVLHTGFGINRRFLQTY